MFFDAPAGRLAQAVAEIGVRLIEPLRGLTPRLGYDVLPDGQHFVMVQREGQASELRLTIVVNWLAELSRRFSH